MKPARFHFWQLAAAVALATLAVACGTGDDESARTGEMAPADQQVLRLRLGAEPRTLDPHQANFTTDISVVKQLFSSLFRYDERLNVVPDMAAELPTTENGGISRDGKTYTVRLRRDLKWSDGAPLTADDVVFGLKRMLDPKVASPYAGNFGVIAGAREYSTALGTKSAPKAPSDAELAALREAVGVTAKDERTVVFTLTAPSASFLNQLALWASAPVRKDVIERGPSWTEAGSLVGNGPFVLTEWTHGARLALEPNPNWHLGRALLSKVTLSIIEDEVAAFAAYQAGEIDVAPVPPASRREVATSGSPLNADLKRQVDLGTAALAFNSQDKPFDNHKVRQAFATAVDRRALIEGVLQGVGVAANGWLPPGMPGYEAAAGKQYEFDPAKARALLAAAGYPNGEGLPKVTLFLRTNDTNRLIAQFMQEQFRRNLGVEVNVELVDAATYQSRFTRGDFNMSMSGWSADWAYPDNWLPEHFGTNGNFNVYHYSNPRVDELLEKARSETDVRKHLDLYAQVHRLVLEDAAIAPLYHRETFIVVKGRVRDLQVTGLDGYLRGDWNLWKTWIAKG
ncbi:MAG TPA: peptide ABC transporter substrate-binding protein [Dehalococcoidia bacterium]|nr:peptide ABC transporter substrate-binding protein [Dehalococcoidia bacterium]